MATRRRIRKVSTTISLIRLSDAGTMYGEYYKHTYISVKRECSVYSYTHTLSLSVRCALVTFSLRFASLMHFGGSSIFKKHYFLLGFFLILQLSCAKCPDQPAK